MDSTSWRTRIGNSEAGFFHHAFIVEGDREETRNLLRAFLAEEFGMVTEGNPDFSERTYRKFGVDESHELKQAQSRLSVGENGRKIFVISAETFPTEAQNSLLKTIEEPTAGTVLFFIAPSFQFFLPTILSRVVCVRGAENDTLKEALDFLKKSYDERMAVAASFSSKAKDEGDGTESVDDEKTSRAFRLLDGIIRVYYEKGLKNERSPSEDRILRLALRYREYAHGRAPSLKMMFEHLALVAPY